MRVKYSIAFILFLLVLSCKKNQVTIPTEMPPVPEIPDSNTFVGDITDTLTPTQGGFVLMGGGTDVDAAFKWMIQRSGGGNFVVIRADSDYLYNPYVFAFGGISSCQTLVIDTKDKANDPVTEATIRNAEALFIGGGDQWNYASNWKDTKVQNAINYLINTKHAPVGGTSAGMAILGNVYFSAQNGTVTSEQAMSNPYRTEVTLGKDDFIDIPILKQTITDTHYNTRDRQGRHVTFLARMVTDWGMDAKGIACDEQTAVCIDENNIATVYGIGIAHFLHQNNEVPERCTSDTSLTWDRNHEAVKVYNLRGTKIGIGSFNLNDWNTASGGTWLYYYVNDGKFYQN